MELNGQGFEGLDKWFLFIPNDDASSPEPDHLPIIAFTTNEDIDGNPQSDSLPIADFVLEEGVEKSPTSDSSGFWQWPENQLGLPQSNLDNEGIMKQSWNTKRLPRQGGLCDPSWSQRQSWKRSGYKLQYEAVAGKRKKGE